MNSIFRLILIIERLSNPFIEWRHLFRLHTRTNVYGKAGRGGRIKLSAPDWNRIIMISSIKDIN